MGNTSNEHDVKKKARKHKNILIGIKQTCYKNDLKIFSQNVYSNKGIRMILQHILLKKRCI